MKPNSTEVSRPATLAGIRTALERLGPLPDDAWADFAPQLRERRMARDEFFAMAGIDVSEVGFVTSGILRMYYVRNDGREFNKSFLTVGDICGVLGPGNRLYIDALTPAVLFVIPSGALLDLYDRHASWGRLGRRFAEMLSLKKMRREASFLLDSAEERYIAFRAEHGAIEHLIRDYHIASYIGVTPVALSRIKKRLSGIS